MLQGWFAVLILTALFEAVTCLFRFGFKLKSTRDTKFIARLTFGYRIHHGYWGVLLLCLYGVDPQNALVVLGWSLILSDLAHHFLVLWPITGHHDFDIRY